MMAQTIKQISSTVLELDGFRPIFTYEMSKWCKENNISVIEKEETYGPAGFHYNIFLHFKRNADLIAFKLRWM